MLEQSTVTVEKVVPLRGRELVSAVAFACAEETQTSAAGVAFAKLHTRFTTYDELRNLFFPVFIECTASRLQGLCGQRSECRLNYHRNR